MFDDIYKTNQGYEIVHTVIPNGANWGNAIYFLSPPWTTVDLTEINSSELDLRVSPNTAKEYINVEVDFTSQPSKLVLISEKGYIF